MTRKACIIGHPVGHSRSPLIHGYWLRERLAGHAGIRLLDTAALLAD